MGIPFLLLWQSLAWVHATDECMLIFTFSHVFSLENGWFWDECMALARLLFFDQADCVFYLRWFSAVFRSFSYFFRNCQVTSDPAWHLRSVGLLSFLLGIDTEPPCCIWPGRCFIYHDFQQFSGLSHTPFQVLSGNVGSCLAPQIGRFDVENLDSKNPEIYHDFLQFWSKYPGSYHVFRTFPGANPEFCHVFLLFSGKHSQICHVLLTFSGENPRIFYDIQKSLGCLRLQVRRIKFSLYDGVAPRDVRSFLGLSPVRRRQGFNCNLGTRDFLGAGPVGRRKGYNCNLGTRDFWWQAQLEGDRATTGIWELEIFWGQAQLEGDRATTAIWELEIFGGRPS